jgi:uncharacterized protein YciI
MPWFVLIGRDGPDVLEKRKAVRERHLAGLKSLNAAGRIRHAGPLLDPEGTPRGSVIVFDAPDLASARRVFDQDPYITEGVFESVEVFETLDVYPG